jgi:hypothetical protein
VTPAQVAEFGLLTRPTKTSDSRAKHFHGDSVEVDAIDSNVLRSMTEEFIQGFIDHRRLAALRLAESQTERCAALPAMARRCGERQRSPIPACLASGAHQMGEESQLVVFVAARALDRGGAGRVPIQDVRHATGPLFSARQLGRVLMQPESARYWELDRWFLRLRSERSILASFPCEVLRSDHARRLPLAILDSRPRRGAALLAAVLAGIEAPRSNAFVSLFAGVDRKTISRWMKDPVVRDEMLQRLPAWSERRRLPNTWPNRAETTSASMRLKRPAFSSHGIRP